MGSEIGSLCLSLTYMKYFHHAAPWRLVSERPFVLPLWSSWTVNFTAECACLFVAAAIFPKLEKQDQCCILAQKFLLCGNLLTRFFRESLFRTRIRRAVKYRARNCRKECAECKIAYE